MAPRGVDAACVGSVSNAVRNSPYREPRKLTLAVSSGRIAQALALSLKRFFSAKTCSAAFSRRSFSRRRRCRSASDSSFGSAKEKVAGRVIPPMISAGLSRGRGGRRTADGGEEMGADDAAAGFEAIGRFSAETAGAGSG